jgi:hypothetical protein
MFEPISARLASSFSRNGISAAATDTSCLGDTSISRRDPRRHHEFAGFAAEIRSSTKLAFGVEFGVGLRDVCLASSIAER